MIDTTIVRGAIGRHGHVSTITVVGYSDAEVSRLIAAARREWQAEASLWVYLQGWVVGVIGSVAVFIVLGILGL